MLDHKVALVTGATSGIGYFTALGLAERGAHVVLGGRSKARTEQAVQQIKRAVPGAKAEYLLGDLSSMRDVRSLAEEFLGRYSRLDILVNNAGGLFMSRRLSIDGHEMTFALNHLSYFLLTDLLREILVESAPARVVNVSSEAHRRARFPFEQLNDSGRYFGWRAYGQSKLANVMFTYELDRQLSGTDVTANALHPGFVRTGLGAKNANPIIGLLARLAFLGGISPQRGAETSLLLASSPELKGVSGQYYSVGRRVRSSRRSYDETAAKRLWDFSRELLGMG